VFNTPVIVPQPVWKILISHSNAGAWHRSSRQRHSTKVFQKFRTVVQAQGGSVPHEEGSSNGIAGVMREPPNYLRGIAGTAVVLALLVASVFAIFRYLI
jgi:hypothetical protein